MVIRRDALAARREALGFTQERLAQDLGVELSTVGRWERGTLTPLPWRRPDLAKALKLSLEELDGLLNPSAPQSVVGDPITPAHDDTLAEFGSKPVWSSNLPTRAVTGTSLPLTKPRHVPSKEPVGHIVDAAADESDRFAAWAEEENVGELTIEQMHSQIRQISQAYLKTPTGPLFARTRELRNRTFTLLAGQHRPSHARDLYAIAGWSLTVLAWMSVDLGRPDAGEDHARAAWLCADRAEHNGLRAWVRATQHTAAFWQGDFGRAADYAADGLRYATGSATLFLTSAHALDLARSGRDEQAWAALRRARAAAESAEPITDELAGPFTCSVDRAQGGFWSETQLALGVADAALDQSNRAVIAFESAPAQQRNPGSERMMRLLKVRAHLALGQLDSAEDTLVPVLETAPELRARPLLVRMSDVSVAASASQRAGDPAAVRIRAEVQAFQRSAKTRELGR